MLSLGGHAISKGTSNVLQGGGCQWSVVKDHTYTFFWTLPLWIGFFFMIKELFYYNFQVIVHYKYMEQKRVELLPLTLFCLREQNSQLHPQYILGTETPRPGTTISNSSLVYKGYSCLFTGLQIVKQLKIAAICKMLEIHFIYSRNPIIYSENLIIYSENRIIYSENNFFNPSLREGSNF